MAYGNTTFFEGILLLKLKGFMTAFQYGYVPIYKLTKLISDSFENKNRNFIM